MIELLIREAFLFFLDKFISPQVVSPRLAAIALVVFICGFG